MGILKNIWITIFGKSKKQKEFEKNQEKFGRGGSIEEPKMKIVHRGKIGGYTSGDVEADKSRSCTYQYTERMICRPNLPIDACKPQTFLPTTCDAIITTNDAKPLIDIPSGDGFFVSNELLSREKLIDSQIKFEVSKPKTKKAFIERPKGDVMTKEQAVLEYLLKYGSIDKRTCAEKFGLKRLDNVICELRKQGMNIKNETVELHNELGEKTKVNNYRLVNSDGTN
jgi:hypothetical protein